MKKKLIDPCPNRRYDDIFEAGIKMMDESFGLPDNSTSSIKAELADALRDLCYLKRYKDTFGETAFYKQVEGETWSTAFRLMNIPK